MAQSLTTASAVHIRDASKDERHDVPENIHLHPSKLNASMASTSGVAMPGTR